MRGRIIAEPRQLALWARRFTLLVTSGVNLAQALEVLRAESDEPLDEVSAGLRADILEGSTLSEAMRKFPDVFTPLALMMCRAGEVGGVLDKTIARWAGWIERNLAFRDRFDTLLLLAQAVGKSTPEMGEYMRDEIPDISERMRAIAFCRMFGMCLASRVPLLRALAVAEELFVDDPDAVGVLTGVGNELVEGKTDALARMLERLGLPPVVCILGQVGEETGQLDVRMEDAAGFLEYEMETKMSAALAKLAANLKD
jgi:type II secretory pathway component PulF